MDTVYEAASMIADIPHRMQRNNEGPLQRGAARINLILFFTCFLPAALARERFLHALLLTGFQIKGVPLDLLDDVFLLHLPLEPAQSILEGFTLLKSDFRQELHPQTRPDWDQIVIARLGVQSQELVGAPHTQVVLATPRITQ